MTPPKSHSVEHRIADAIAPKMERVFRDAIHNAAAQVSLKVLLDKMDVEAIPWRTMETLLFKAFRSMFEDTIEEAANAHAKLLPESQLKKATPSFLASIGLRFDLNNLRVFRWIQNHALEMVFGVTENSKLAIREILRRSFEGQMTVRQQAMFIRDLIGLDPRRAKALNNFRIQMIGEVPDGKAERLLVQYRKRLIADRASTIARTESITASAQGQHALWLQALEQGFLDNDVRRRPVVTPDTRLCELCSPMPSNPLNTVRLNEPFTRGDGLLVMNPAFHPNCRCSVVLLFPDRKGNYKPVPSLIPAFAGGKPPRRRRKPKV